MNRLGWFIAGIILISIVCFVLSILPVPPCAYVPPWSTPQIPVLWAPWAEGLKVMSTLIAGIAGLYYGFFVNIAGFMKTPIRIIGIGCTLLAIGAGWEMWFRLNGQDPSVLTAASIPFIVGSILVVIALFALPGKLNARMTRSQSWIYAGTIVAMITITVLLFFVTSEADRMPFQETLTCATYDLAILLIFIASVRLVILFQHGTMGRSFLLIAISGFCIGLYEYYIWMPFIHNVSIFNPIQILWSAGFLLTAAGITDSKLED